MEKSVKCKLSNSGKPKFDMGDRQWSFYRTLDGLIPDSTMAILSQAFSEVEIEPRKQGRFLSCLMR